jgi:hypothetical protein
VKRGRGREGMRGGGAETGGRRARVGRRMRWEVRGRMGTRCRGMMVAQRTHSIEREIILHLGRMRTRCREMLLALCVLALVPLAGALILKSLL